MSVDQEARWSSIFCRVYGFREIDGVFSIPGSRESWMGLSLDHLYAVIRDQFTVAVYWNAVEGAEPTAFWFEGRDYVMTEKDMKTLDAIDHLSGGDFGRLSADWRAWWLANRPGQ